MSRYHDNAEYLSLARLPSVEAKTVQFVNLARRHGRFQPQWLEWGGFRVYLRYARNLWVDEELVLPEVLTIASVEVPARFRGRGWFWRYCQLCALLSPAGVIIECVIDDRLLASLRGRPEYDEYSPRSFLLRPTSLARIGTPP